MESALGAPYDEDPLQDPQLKSLPPNFGDLVSVIRGEVWIEYKKTGKSGRRYPYYRWREEDPEGKVKKRSKYRKGLPPILTEQDYDNWKNKNAELRKTRKRSNDQRRTAPVHSLTV